MNAKADERSFRKTFRKVTYFTTSEDGNLMGVAVDAESEDAALEKFKEETGCSYESKPRRIWVERVLVGSEWFDGTGQTKGKIWMESETPTGFQVWFMDTHEL